MMTQIFAVGVSLLVTAAQDVCLTPDSPAQGQLGTRVTIAGTNLLGFANGTVVTEVYVLLLLGTVRLNPVPMCIILAAPPGGLPVSPPY